MEQIPTFPTRVRNPPTADIIHTHLLTFYGKDGETPLHMAAQEGNMVILDLLLNMSTTVNFRNVYGDTPIFYGHKRSEVIEKLIKCGANTDVRNREGNYYTNWADALDAK